MIDRAAINVTVSRVLDAVEEREAVRVRSGLPPLEPADLVAEVCDRTGPVCRQVRQHGEPLESQVLAVAVAAVLYLSCGGKGVR